MPSAKTDKYLDVYIGASKCGALREDVHGAISFSYDPDYTGAPLSVSMPISLATYSDRIVRPYLQGLMPDEAETRALIGSAYGVSGDNPFRLLEILGLDCPGAVQVCQPNQTVDFEKPDDIERLSINELEDRLRNIRERASSAWTDYGASEGHWSLGGCQSKIALRYEDGRWCACHGSAATTHILKPGIVGYEQQALVEYISMRCASILGLPTAKVQYLKFGSETAVVIDRYDRVRLETGRIHRLHQEDMCQALSVSPLVKYAENGGPTSLAIINLLKRVGHAPRQNVITFVLYLFFNYLIGATDAHAKNYSILLLPDGDVRIAPLYDVASTAAYEDLTPRERKPLRAAMSIGGENRFGHVGARNVKKMAKDAGLFELDIDADLLVQRFQKMAEKVPACLKEAISEAQALDMPINHEMLMNMHKQVSANCRRSLELS